jgi:hypothetical protein
LFAPSHSISQRTTSFIASYRQGIHQMPFCHLITLISNAHLCSRPRHPEKDALTRPHSAWWTLQKDQNFHQDIPGAIADLTISPSPSTPLASRLAALSGVASKASNPGYPLFTMSRIDLHRARPDAETCSLTHGCDRSVLTARSIKDGGARRDRTDDLKLAKLPLSQLSYGPDPFGIKAQLFRPITETPSAQQWWAWEDLNFRPHAYQARALTN